MDAKLTSVVEFVVSADVPQRELTVATDAGLSAARLVVGPTIEATGSLGSARPGGRSVRIAMTLRASPAAALRAEAAFADAFLASIRARGFAGERA